MSGCFEMMVNDMLDLFNIFGIFVDNFSGVENGALNTFNLLGYNLQTYINVFDFSVNTMNINLKRINLSAK